MEYDFKKAKELIIKNKNKLVSAELCMIEDWNWTAETVWEDGKFTQNLDKIKTIGGISGSNWATPTLKLYFKNDFIKELTISKQL